ncbi:unnamed protein product [Ectocarpus sp. 12 AP-2014]
MVHPKHNSFRCFLLSPPSRRYYTRKKMRLPPATHTRCPPVTPPQRLSSRVVRTLYMLPLPSTKRRARLCNTFLDVPPTHNRVKGCSSPRCSFDHLAAPYIYRPP